MTAIGWWPATSTKPAEEADRPRRHEWKSALEDGRNARFVCCIALAFPDGKVETFLGHAEGRISTEPRGDRGFGYDPVFVPAGYDRTFAEMSASEKDSLSHRGKALDKLAGFLRLRFRSK